MKAIYFIVGLIGFVGMGVGLTGCYKDIVTQADPDGPPQQVSFKDDLLPVFVANCALSGCHATGAYKPDLTAKNAYQALNNGIFVNTLVPKQSVLMEKIEGEMRTYIPSANDRRKIYDWIRNGAPNN